MDNHELKVRVIRRSDAGQPGPDWGSLMMRWTISAQGVGARHVCGGWFDFRAGAGAWRRRLRAESAWYVTRGALAVRWGAGAGAGAQDLPSGSFFYAPAGWDVTLQASSATSGLVLFGGETSPHRLDDATAPLEPTRRPWTAHVDTLASDRDYEPPLDMRWGITDRLGEAQHLCAARTLDPPRGRIQHHHHDGVEAIIFFLGGRFRMFSGPHREAIDVEPGDIAYIPPGALHSYCSLEAHAMAEEVAFYGGAVNKEGAHTVFVEAPWNEGVAT